MGQNPTVPVYRGEIQTRNLGMAVEAWSPDGKCGWNVLKCNTVVGLPNQMSAMQLFDYD